jgi:hypothetical protein
VGHTGESFFFKQLVCASIGRVKSVETSDENEVFFGREFRVEKRGMPQVTHGPAVMRRPLNFDLALAGRREAGRDPQQSALAGSIGAEQGKGFTLIQFKINLA